MSSTTPDGWAEVFRGACLEADLVVAVLESEGLKPIREQQSAENLWPGTVFGDCLVFVPVSQAVAAEQALAQREPLDEADEPEA
jgi:hypothetical protein